MGAGLTLATLKAEQRKALADACLGVWNHNRLTYKALAKFGCLEADGRGWKVTAKGQEVYGKMRGRA